MTQTARTLQYDDPNLISYIGASLQKRLHSKCDLHPKPPNLSWQVQLSQMGFSLNKISGKATPDLEEPIEDVRQYAATMAYAKVNHLVVTRTRIASWSHELVQGRDPFDRTIVPS